jgi:hypothetical protein
MVIEHKTLCGCDLRQRAWNPNTGRCETCRSRFIDQRSFRRSIWDRVADHIEQRGAALGTAARIVGVSADMRARASVHGPLDAERLIIDYLDRAYVKAIDFVGFLAAELAAHGATIDDPIDIRAPHSARLVRVQAMLWDHVRTVVQLRALVEERSS